MEGCLSTSESLVTAPSSSSIGGTFRAFPYTAWTGEELLVWSGYCDDAATCPPEDPNDGALYDPQADSWRAITPVEAPAGRADLCTGAWTGGELFVFGGSYANLMESETGGLYCANGGAPALIFADGFESGDTSAWSTTVP